MASQFTAHQTNQEFTSHHIIVENLISRAKRQFGASTSTTPRVWDRL
jgi:hypothetical protein